MNIANNAAYKGWWCSNGLFNQVTTAGSAATSNGLQVFYNSLKGRAAGNILPTNARQEIATVGCPQRSKACGTNVIIDVDVSPIANNVVTMLSTLKNLPGEDPSTGLYMSTSDKCTWVAKSVKGAPNFTIQKGATYGLVGNTW